MRYFKEKYYRGQMADQLQLSAGEQSLSGEFDRYTLGVYFAGIDKGYLDKMKNIIDEIMSDSTEDDFSGSILPEQMVVRYPKMIDIFIGQELQVHEYFHLFQTLCLPSVFALYKASRELASLKVMIFVGYIKLGGKIKIDSADSLFDLIGKMGDNEINGYVESLFDMYKDNVQVIDNFFYYEKSSLLNMVDLVEGAAFAFQKLILRTINIDTFSPGTDSCYKKALLYYKQKGGENDIVFLVLAHMSLKYGLLDDGDFMKYKPTPQKLFEMLCDNLAKYENILENLPACICFFFEYENAEKLRRWGFDISQNQVEWINSLSLNDGHLYIIGNVLLLLKIIKKDIQESFVDSGLKFVEPEIDFDDQRINAIHKNIVYKYQNYMSDLFFAVIVVDYNFSIKFLCKDLQELKDVEYKGVFGEETSTLMDDNLYRLATEVDMLLKNGVTYCCEDHGNLPRRNLILNKSVKCLNNRFYSFFNIDMEGVIK